MLSKSCPSCKAPIHVEALRKNGLLKTYLKRQPIACPHCQQSIQLPPFAEKLISVGVLFSVILAPLSYYWRDQLDAISLSAFCSGLVLLITGISQNYPRTVNTQQQTSTRNTMSKRED